MYVWIKKDQEDDKKMMDKGVNFILGFNITP